MKWGFSLLSIRKEEIQAPVDNSRVREMWMSQQASRNHGHSSVDIFGEIWNRLLMWNSSIKSKNRNQTMCWALSSIMGFFLWPCLLVFSTPLCKKVFPGGTKEATFNAGDARDVGSISGLGRSPEEGNGNLFQYSCLGNSMDRGAWWAPCGETTSAPTPPQAKSRLPAKCPSDPGFCTHSHLSFLVQGPSLLLDYESPVGRTVSCLPPSPQGLAGSLAHSRSLTDVDKCVN